MCRYEIGRKLCVWHLNQPMRLGRVICSRFVNVLSLIGFQSCSLLAVKSPYRIFVLFGPEGAISKFIQNNLNNFIVWRAGKYEVATMDGISLQLSREALDNLGKARAIQDAFFGSGNLQFRFSLTPIISILLRFDHWWKWIK